MNCRQYHLVRIHSIKINNMNTTKFCKFDTSVYLNAKETWRKNYHHSKIMKKYFIINNINTNCRASGLCEGYSHSKALINDS